MIDASVSADQTAVATRLVVQNWTSELQRLVPTR